MSRAEGWERRLASYLADRAAMPFAWGSHDCCRFACHGLAAQGTPDPMAGVRPYSTARGAAGAIKRLGGTLDAAATKLAAKAGLHEIAPAFAGRGCVVMTEVEISPDTTEPALGLVGIDGTLAFFAGIDGLVTYPMTACRRAWGFD